MSKSNSSDDEDPNSDRAKDIQHSVTEENKSSEMESDKQTKISILNENSNEQAADTTVTTSNRVASSYLPDTVIEIENENRSIGEQSSRWWNIKKWITRKPSRMDEQNVIDHTRLVLPQEWIQSYPQLEQRRQNRKRWHRDQSVNSDEYLPKRQNLYPPQGQEPLKVMVGMKGEPTGDALNYDPSRNLFIAIVMFIDMVMLVITAIVVITVFRSEDLTKLFMKFSGPIVTVGGIMIMGINYAFMCVPFTRKLPCNIVMLLLSVFVMSMIAAAVTCRYQTEGVIYAAITTACIVFICFVLALTPFDFTAWYLYVIVIAGVFCIVSMVILIGMIITGHYMPVLHLLILIISVLVQSVVLVIELQMILGGKAIEIGDEDWALAAFLIYTSVIDIFIKIIQILGIAEDLL